MRAALELLLSTAQPVIDSDGNVKEICIDTRISEEQYKEILALTAPKVKKGKGEK